MRFHRLTSLLVLGVLSLAAAPRAYAQTTAEKATAELLFDQALADMRDGKFSEGCQKLESSQRIDPAVGTLLYLSECYEKQGRTASAWVTFRDAAALARAQGQNDRADVAEKRADQLQKELALVTIDIAPDARAVKDLKVRCGPVPVDISLGTITVPVDPGQVTVEATAPGYLPFTRQLNVDARGRGTIVIPALTSDGSTPPPQPGPVTAGVAPGNAAAEPQAGAPPPTPPPNADSESSSVPVASLVLGGVGIVGLGVGSYFGVKAMNDADEANDLCPDGNCSSQHGEDLMDDARTSATVSNIAFGVGAASIAVGLVLYFVDSDSEASASAGNRSAAHRSAAHRSAARRSAAHGGLVPLAVDRGAGLAWRGNL